jgi:hypothetical protein
MSRFRLVLVLLAVVGVVRCTVAAPLTDDRAKLKGDWKGVNSGIVFRCTFGEGFTFKAEGANVNLSGENLGYGLQEEGGKRIIELDRRAAELNNIPHLIPYRIEDDTLTVTFPEGALRGTWKLTREKK